MTRDDRDADEDPYAALARGMTPGLLVTFNETTPTAPATTELEVVYVDEDRPLVSLKENDDQYYRFFWDHGHGMTLCEVDDEGHKSHFTDVETIEVVGVE